MHECNPRYSYLDRWRPCHIAGQIWISSWANNQTVGRRLETFGFLTEKKNQCITYRVARHSNWAHDFPSLLQKRAVQYSIKSWFSRITLWLYHRCWADVLHWTVSAAAQSWWALEIKTPVHVCQLFWGFPWLQFKVVLQNSSISLTTLHLNDVRVSHRGLTELDESSVHHVAHTHHSHSHSQLGGILESTIYLNMDVFRLWNMLTWHRWCNNVNTKGVLDCI